MSEPWWPDGVSTISIEAQNERLRTSNAELLAALRCAQSQIHLLGTPDDSVNNAVLEKVNAAIANAEKALKP